MKKKYAIVGLGGRHDMYLSAICETYKEKCELALVSDINEGRIEKSKKRAKELGGYEPEGCHPNELINKMSALSISELIVTTVDSFHDDYICIALENGFDVITEKPMTIDEKKCKRILETQKKTGRRIRVTFNYRYSPVRSQVKELLMTGIIGDILSIDFHWMLNLSHGADYFRRWHRWKKNSGGLMVHKATHHFDLVNWWLDTVPERIFASGHRKFYRPETAENYGLKNRSERCLDCPEKKKCNFYFDLNKTDSLRELYLKNEKFDGYFRDRCVFSADMDIEDCMNVIVDYKNGTKMSYSLNAFVSWEGYIISFNGTKGRLEHKCEESVYTSGDESVQGALLPEGTWIKIYPNWKPAYSVKIKQSEGGHGGGDPIMLSEIFEPEKQGKDPLKRAADHRSGAWSILTGIAANHSMKNNSPIEIKQLIDDIELP